MVPEEQKAKEDVAKDKEEPVVPLEIKKPNLVEPKAKQTSE